MNNQVNQSINDFYNSIDYSKPLPQYANELDFSRVESLFYKIVVILFAISIFKIVMFYVMNKLKISTKKKEKNFFDMNIFEQRRALKNFEKKHTGKSNNVDTHFVIAHDSQESEEYNSEIVVKSQSDEIQALSSKARVMFTSAIKSKQLNRDEILAIRSMLRKNTKRLNKKYENDAHEICSRLKHYSINEDAILSVIDFLQTSYIKNS